MATFRSWNQTCRVFFCFWITTESSQTLSSSYGVSFILHANNALIWWGCVWIHRSPQSTPWSQADFLINTFRGIKSVLSVCSRRYTWYSLLKDFPQRSSDHFYVPTTQKVYELVLLRLSINLSSIVFCSIACYKINLEYMIICVRIPCYYLKCEIEKQDKIWR